MIRAIFLLLAVIFPVFSLPAAEPEEVPCAQPGIPPREALAKMNAEQLFNRLCAVCHKKDLSGGFGPSLVNGEWKHGSSDEEILRTIKEGNLELGMLPWKHTLTDAQIRSLIIYIREKEREALGKNAGFPRAEPGKTTHTALHDYRFETVVPKGLENPTSFAFLPDGTMLVAELGGHVRLVTAQGELDPNPVEGTPETTASGDGGFLDIAPHPDYRNNGWVYLSFAHALKNGAGNNNAPRAMTAVVRGRIKGHRWVDQEWVWKADPKFYSASETQFGGGMAFDRGMLLLAVGDRDGWQKAQDLATPLGKVFRLLADGKIPSHGPGFEQPGALPGIWAFGLRDPRALAVDPSAGSLYCTDRGPRGGDELNWLRPGRNYGWPIVTHGMHPDGTPITAETEREGMESPIASWTPSIGVAGFTFYTGEKFPKWKNNLFLAGQKTREVHRLEIANHMVAAQEIILKTPANIRDITEGPDGSLYLLLDNPASIARLLPK